MFTKVLVPVLVVLCFQGTAIVGYLDNLLLSEHLVQIITDIIRYRPKTVWFDPEVSSGTDTSHGVCIVYP